MDTTTLRISRAIRAPPEAVYRAFIDPAAFARWYPPIGLEGRVLSMDARRGGRYRMEIATPDRSWMLTFGGVYEDLVPGERIVFTNVPETRDPDLAGEMRITIDLRRTPDGTLVEIVHEGIPRGGSRAFQGWQESLDNLARLLATDAPTKEEIH